MRHFRKDLKTATRLGAVLDPFKSIIYTSIRARARRFIIIAANASFPPKYCVKRRFVVVRGC